MLDKLQCTRLVCAYGRQGQFDAAKLIFDQAQGRDVILWNALLSAHLNNGQQWDAAGNTLAKMPQHDTVSWTSVLGSYARGARHGEARRVFDGMLHRDFPSWNALLHGLAENGEAVSQAAEVFAKMPQRSHASWNAMILAYAAGGYIDLSRLTMDSSPLCGGPCTSTMFIAYVKAGRTRQAMEMFDRLQQRNLVLWSLMFGAFASCIDVDSAEQLFGAMPATDVVSWTALVQLYAEAGEVTKANAVFFTAMPCRNVVSWSLLVAVNAQHGYNDVAFSILSRMPQQSMSAWNSVLVSDNITPGAARQTFLAMPERDVTSWTSMLAVYGRSRDKNSVKQLFDGMPQRNLVSWNVALSGLALDAGMAKQFFDKMPGWDCVSENTLLAVYAHNAHVEAVSSWFERIRNRDSVSWDTAITLFARTGKIDRALQLLHQANLKGDCSGKEEIAFLSLLNACSHLGLVRQGLFLFLSMQGDYNIVPSNYHYCCMLDTLARSGRSNDAEKLLRTMPFEPGEVAWKALLSSCLELEH